MNRYIEGGGGGKKKKKRREESCRRAGKDSGAYQRHKQGRREQVMTSVFPFTLFAPRGSLVFIIHTAHGRIEMKEWSLLKRRRGK